MVISSVPSKTVVASIPGPVVPRIAISTLRRWFPLGDCREPCAEKRVGFAPCALMLENSLTKQVMGLDFSPSFQMMCPNHSLSLEARRSREEERKLVALTKKTCISINLT